MTNKKEEFFHPYKKQPESQKKEKRVIKALVSWKIKEFEKHNHDLKFYFILYVVLFLITAYGLIMNNLLLSILSILFGFTFFMFEKKDPENMNFAITKKGILVHDHLYSYSSLESFWVEYEPEGIKELSFKTNQFFRPYIKIPLDNSDPVKIRKILLDFIPEEENKIGITDLLDRF